MRKLSLCLLAAATSAVMLSTAQAGETIAFDIRAVPTPGGRVLRFPAAAPAQTVFGTFNFDSFAMDYNSAATTLYAVDEVAAGPGSLGTINLLAGGSTFTPIAPISGAAAAEVSFTGLKVDPTDETFFLSSGTSLYTVNPVTGVTALRGNFGITGGIAIDIAIHANGTMYAHDIGTDSLYTVNKATGAATLIGPTGQPLANFAQGMDFDYDTNLLYAAIYTGGGTGVYATFNLGTGAANVITSTTTWNAEMEMVVRAAIPEPASLSFVALAGLGLARRSRRA